MVSARSRSKTRTEIRRQRPVLYHSSDAAIDSRSVIAGACVAAKLAAVIVTVDTRPLCVVRVVVMMQTLPEAPVAEARSPPLLRRTWLTMTAGGLEVRLMTTEMEAQQEGARSHQTSLEPRSSAQASDDDAMPLRSDMIAHQLHSSALHADSTGGILRSDGKHKRHRQQEE